jgi:pimeloyl-ACP methyl ester carboxylesterase
MQILGSLGRPRPRIHNLDHYDHDGLRFDVTDVGPTDREVVVLLHGYPETRSSWDRVTPYLIDAGYRVLAPDQRGYSPGARPRGRRAYRLECLVADVVALIDTVGVDRVHLMGHDWGGAVSWAMAAWYPDRLSTMTSLTTPHPRALLRSMFSSNQARRSWYIAFYQLPWLPEMGFRSLGLAATRRAFERSGLDGESLDASLEILARPGAATAAINWYRAIPFTAPGRLGSSTVPTLYVYASEDVALGRRAADLTARYVTNGYRYEVLSGSNHWLPEQMPDVVARLFLAHASSY